MADCWADVLVVMKVVKMAGRLADLMVDYLVAC